MFEQTTSGERPALQATLFCCTVPKQIKVGIAPSKGRTLIGDVLVDIVRNRLQCHMTNPECIALVVGNDPTSPQRLADAVEEGHVAKASKKEEEPSKVWQDWDLGTWRKEEARIRSRREQGLDYDCDDKYSSYQKARHAVHHERTGVLGAALYQATSSPVRAVQTITDVVEHLNLMDEVAAELMHSRRGRRDLRGEDLHRRTTWGREAGARSLRARASTRATRPSRWSGSTATQWTPKAFTSHPGTTWRPGTTKISASSSTLPRCAQRALR
mmetsp:Transcript_11644/g.39786  ORF Transcript_11644/g.39786 Transcript_11644/m.39786 type:complete len:271 (-) Transcript_11644:309-1121(-)